MSKSIDLGRKVGENIKAISAKDFKEELKKTHYPSLYLDGDDPRLLDIPDSGKCVITYKIRRREHRETKNGDGKPKKSCSIDMDVTSIEPPEGKSYKKDSDGGARKAFNDYFEKKDRDE